MRIRSQSGVECRTSPRDVLERGRSLARSTYARQKTPGFSNDLFAIHVLRPGTGRAPSGALRRCAPLTKRAFTLIEVMIALGIFFVCVFAILGVLSNGLKNARYLQQRSADSGMVAATLSISNIITEGLESGDFGDMYPGYTWARDAYEDGTNGLYKVDIIVQKPDGTEESRMTIRLFSPQSLKANAKSGTATAGKILR